MPATKTNKSRHFGNTGDASASAGTSNNAGTGRKPTEEEVEDALDWAEGFQDRHSDLFDRLAEE